MLKKLVILILPVCMLAQGAQAMETLAKQAFMIDPNTGTVLFSKNADEMMHPSSMSKLMTIYVAFHRLKEGRLSLDDKLPVSEKAWRKQGSKTFVKVGDEVSVRTLLQGIIVQSGNDACIVVAEGISGSEEAFAEEMNRMAKELGMEHSHFVNATGWPDDEHLMTAHDLATLAVHLINDFPEYHQFFSELEYTYNGIRQHNRNPLLGEKDLGVDGMKTGHTDAGGYGITLSALKDGRRLILVVNGLSSENERKEEGKKLLAYGFREFQNRKLLKEGMEVGKADVWFGASANVPLVAEHDFLATIPAGNNPKISFKLVYQSPLLPPITKGSHVADLHIDIPGQEPVTVPIVAGSDVAKLSGFSKIGPLIDYYMHGK